MKTVIELDPRKVVDVGPGWGKYGLMCREYLPDLRKLTAVEAYHCPASALERAQNSIYDQIVYCDVRGLDAEWWSVVSPDLTLLIDVLEHLSREDGHHLLARIINAGGWVLVSTPKIFFHQHDADNPFEEHVSHWTWEDFLRYGIRKDVSTRDSIIFLLGHEG